MYRDTIQAEPIEITDFEPTTFDYLVARLRYPLKRICTVVLYHQTKPKAAGKVIENPRTIFQTELRTLLSKLSGYENLVLMGDFNIRMDEKYGKEKKKPANEVTVLNQILEENGLQQHVDEPTQINGQHLIDLVISRKSEGWPTLARIVSDTDTSI